MLVPDSAIVGNWARPVNGTVNLQVRWRVSDCSPSQFWLLGTRIAFQRRIERIELTCRPQRIEPHKQKASRSHSGLDLFEKCAALKPRFIFCQLLALFSSIPRKQSTNNGSTHLINPPRSNKRDRCTSCSCRPLHIAEPALVKRRNTEFSQVVDLPWHDDQP